MRQTSCMLSEAPFLQLHQVSHHYRTAGVFTRRTAATLSLQHVSLDLHAGERVALVGASGCGKSTLLKILLALEPPTRGTVHCQGREVRPARVSRLRWYRRLVQYIPQDPAGSLAPHASVFALIAEPLRQLGMTENLKQTVCEVLEQVDLPLTLLHQRAESLSGGQAQRVAIARAIALRPAFLLADEPVSGLDLPLRQQVTTLLDTLSRRHGMGLLLVSHDLSVVAALCQRVLVMYNGSLVEDRPLPDLLAEPFHFHTQALLAAVPTLPAFA
ncbi:ABC transporter ATP-binding protein [Dickeya fangzhongdai]|uniref:ABC transporter ATP-binding protein n=2 Tax=Dickeya fangzhongdai TaxID=1778540 RepID=UPI0004F79494|nr:dipeptide/oligopeptide/nickel ABC transporter ATP-binding protein [Dickeya fangzhongdai]AIR68034.1 ABC transporter permease [Dickeya fangzhongdai]KGT96599.1 ABC transporter permease [Dickeya fangzhongdai]